MRRLPCALKVVSCLILCLCFLSTSFRVLAQTAILERLPTDVTIRIINGTTGQPARAEHLLLRDPSPSVSTLVENHNIDGEVTFSGLMLYNYKRYIATAWVDGVAYHAEQRGQDFRDGKALVVYCFSPSEDLAGVTMTGMNIVVRQRPDGFGLEYIMIVANESRPQHTITAKSLPVQLSLPSALEHLQVEVGGSGLDPRKAELKPADGGRQGLAVALTPGVTRLTVRGVLPDIKRAELTASTNLAVDAWSLLAWPAELQVHSFDLKRDDQNTYPGFSRWLGKPLSPDEKVRITIDQVAHLADLLPEDALDSFELQPDTPGRQDSRTRFPWRTVLAAIVLIGCYLFWRSRR